MTRYYITVKSQDDNFLAYFAVDDIESATELAEFCHASMPGARVSIDQIDWRTDNEGY